MAPKPKVPPFQSAAQRRALFAEAPDYAREIASTRGAKVGGGFTKAQISRRRSAAGKGESYQPKER
jgi:hypothetical protein